MTKKGWSCVNSIINNGYKHLINLIVIGQDKNISNDYSKEIQQACEHHQLPYRFRNETIILSSKYIIAISWRWLIPLKKDATLIVFHDSLLPKYRGFAPLVNQLINKETSIGVTALFATENYDEGPIIAQKKIKITYPIKIQEAISKISLLYVDLLQIILTKIATKEKLEAKEQNHNLASYSLWRNKNDYFIDWNWDAQKIQLFIDAVGPPYEGAKTYLDKKIIIIQEATIFPDAQIMNRDVGKIIFFRDSRPIIVCKKGLLKIEKAIYEDSKQSLFPFKKFRCQFS
jgi:methionyl-tRNA formyltransferase